MIKAVAVTGAGGFVGSRLVQNLLKQGSHVYALTSRPAFLPAHERLETIVCDWTKPSLERAVAQAQGADLWVHTAARIDFGDQNALPLYHDNALLTGDIADLISKTTEAARLVYLSSISVYSADQELSARIEPQPATHYGMSKLLGERLCLAHLGERCAVLRLAGVWGRDESKLFINRCLENAKNGQPLTMQGSGYSKRNYLWNGDISRIINWLYEKQLHGVHLAAGPEPVSMREMMSEIAAQFGVPAHFELADPTQIEADMIVQTAPELPSTRFSEALAMEKEIL